MSTSETTLETPALTGTIEIDDEAITINQVRYHSPPTVQELAELLSSFPRQIDGTEPYNKGTTSWVWDELGLAVCGKSETDLNCIVIALRPGSNPNESASAFSGRLSIFGADPRETTGRESLSRRLTNGVNGMFANGKYHFQGRLSVNAPWVTWFQENRVVFHFPWRRYVPIQTLRPSERVLASFDSWVDFSASLTNHRLMIVVPGTPLFQWSLSDIRGIRIRANVDAGSISNSIKAWHNTSWFVLLVNKIFARGAFQPPYHVIDIDTFSTGCTSIATTRHLVEPNGPDNTLCRLENLADCVAYALPRYRASAPSLPLLPRDADSSATTAKNPETPPPTSKPGLMDYLIKGLMESIGGGFAKPVKALFAFLVFIVLVIAACVAFFFFAR
jgi:hypothetical protein